MADEPQGTPEAEAGAATEAAPPADGEPKPEKLHQEVEIADVGPCKKHIKVSVDRADIDKRTEEKYK